MKEADKKLVEAAAKAAQGPMKEVPMGAQPAPVQLDPVRLMFVANAGGVGFTADGQKFIKVDQFPFEITLLLSEEFRRAVVKGLTGGVELPQ